MWYFQNQLFDNVIEEFDSFVYIIERLNILEDDESPIYYIGKKTFYNKSKFKGKRIIVESDWWDYYGSSDWLQEDIKKYGKENFKRTILHLCRTKGDAGYLEAKEQIERNVLHIDENNKKLYYNKNILGRYRNEPEFYIIEEDIQSYFNLDTIHGNNYNKKWITDSKNNRLVSKNIAEELVNTGKWTYGRCEKHIEVNDGISNLFIPKSEFKSDIHSLGWLKKYVTNGVEDKLIPLHNIDEFISNNGDWRVGYSKNKNDIWITDGKIDKKIKRDDLHNHETFKPGRTKNGVRNKISVFKNEQFKWIFDFELDSYISDGWERKGRQSDFKLYIVTNDVNQKNFRSEEEKNEFLKNNSDWRDGQIHRESFNTKDTVFAKDMRTDEKIVVTKEEYSKNEFLTSVKTKKVKIKKNNRIIFKGYLDLFLIENEQYPKNQLMNALRSNSGDVKIMKGKNTWLNDEKLNITLL